MNIVLWIVQVVLGGGFLYSGFLKAFQYETAQSMMAWVNDVPQGIIFTIGILELVGALGLILPMALRIKPILTPIAAVGFATLMLSAGIFHLLRNESGLVINIVLMVLALFIAFGRFRLSARQGVSNIAK